MWVLLRTKLPTVVSPPKLSIFWSVPWPMDYRSEGKFGWGLEPDWANARKIKYKGENIRIFPHEFVEIEPAKLILYIDEKVFELVPDSIAEEELIDEVLTKHRRKYYEAALIDGCTHAQALMVAFGKDPTIEDPNIPAIGWYRCVPEYARYFCYENEMKETFPAMEEQNDSASRP